MKEASNIRTRICTRVGLIGDYDSGVLAHRAIPVAIELAAQQLKFAAAFEWVATDEITGTERLSRFDGLWCVPASPYRSMEGALLAIQYARERGCPFLGTCAGFQHAVLEYARNVLGWQDAEHAETAPNAGRAVITALECSLVEVSDTILLEPDTHIAKAYGRTQIQESYHCRYGLNRAFLSHLTSGELKLAAVDRAGEVRGLELGNHPFFVTTLFQPERAALKGECPPLAAAFLRACSPPHDIS